MLHSPLYGMLHSPLYGMLHSPLEFLEYKIASMAINLPVSTYYDRKVIGNKITRGWGKFNSNYSMHLCIIVIYMLAMYQCAPFMLSL